MMLDEITIRGFKKFRWHDGFTLKAFRRVNVFVGPNGSGKSSLLELLCLFLPFATKSGQIAAHLNTPIRNTFYSLFEGNVRLHFKIKDKEYQVILSVDSGDYNVWEIKSEPNDATLKIAIKYLGDSWDPDGDQPWVNNFQMERFTKNHSVRALNDHVDLFDSSGASVEKIETAYTQFGPIHQQKQNRSINERFFSGGVHNMATITSLLDFPNDDALHLALIDEPDNGLFPQMRKVMLDEIVEKSKQSPTHLQIFMTTHNIEVVAAALNNPDCNVYYFSPNGMPMIVGEDCLLESSTSHGIGSLDSALLISAMLGIEPKDIGLPEIPLLVEEQTKKTLLEAYLSRSDIKSQYKHLDILVSGGGDGNLSADLERLAQMSKYFAFSQSWASSYVIFTDWSQDYFNDLGLAKGSPSNGGNNPKQKIKTAQEKLKSRFILTKVEGAPVPMVELMYPNPIWGKFQTNQNIHTSMKDWLKSATSKQKNELAKFVGKEITKKEFQSHFEELHNIIVRG
jgi:AAA15 family ATPase/GTPase